jgi:hypothetical protein
MNLNELPPIRDERSYTWTQVQELIKKAGEQGHPLDALRQLTAAQIDALVNGRYDA